MTNNDLIKIEGMTPPDYKLRPGDYLKKGWELFKQNALMFIGFSVVALIVLLSLNAWSGMGQLLSYIIGPPIWAGFLIVAMKMLLGQPIEVNDFTLGFKFILPLVLYSVVSSIFITVGLIFLIIPGLYLAVGYIFTTWLIVDRRLDFWPAMELSRKTVHKRWFEVFGFFLILVLINLAGMLFFLVGLMITVPWTLCSLTVAYKDIFGIQSSSFEGKL
ncbi:MAG: hypothetical protein FJ135_04975 [Deltaproteobacteria bacterium]|nr:hypothetical protein [Deltaproteobacteria bacterium]